MASINLLNGKEHIDNEPEALGTYVTELRRANKNIRNNHNYDSEMQIARNHKRQYCCEDGESCKRCARIRRYM